MEHFGDEADGWGLCGIGFIELEDELEGAVLVRCFCRTKDDCVESQEVIRKWSSRDSPSGLFG
jgi:hypothetical protein